MSVYYDDEAKVDSLAEGILQRAEHRVLVHNHYTYEAVARMKENDKLRGKNIKKSFILLRVVFQFI